MNLYILWWIFK